MRLPLRRKALSASPTVVEAVQDRRTNFAIALGGTNRQVQAAFQRGQAASYGWMYVNQPAVRSVVDYIASNVAQLGLKLYERIDDNERDRREDHPAAETMANPDGQTPADEFIFRLVADFLVYDNAYLLKFRPDVGEKLTIVRVPAGMVTVSGGRFTPEAYRIYRFDGSYFDVAPDDIIHWAGYNPDDPLLGVSKLETLRQTLIEDQVSQATTVELMRSGLKGGHIERPLEAPEWTQEARERFQEDFRNQRTSAKKGDPVLEEGMKYVADAITPKDAEILASRRFTREEVAKQFGMEHCPPEDEEERNQFYADVLPPIVNSCAGRLNLGLLLAEYDARSYYFEFDLNAKLRGDPEKRFQAITAAVGAPWLLRNEARAMENRPPVDGGDELVTPLNVLVGDDPKPAPNVMGPQDPNKPAQDGSHRTTPKAIEAKSLMPRRKADMDRQHRYIDEAHGLLQRYYGRQARSLQAKALKFDSTRWNRELADDLNGLIASIVEREGGLYVARLAGNDFDLRRVTHYMRAMASGVAEALNRVTAADISDLGAEQAFNRARGERAAVAAASIGTRSTVFARREAAKQSPAAEFRKQVWIADTDRHASLDGVAVSLDSDWGGISPGSEPNCACSASVE